MKGRRQQTKRVDISVSGETMYRQIVNNYQRQGKYAQPHPDRYISHTNRNRTRSLSISWILWQVIWKLSRICLIQRAGTSSVARIPSPTALKRPSIVWRILYWSKAPDRAGLEATLLTRLLWQGRTTISLWTKYEAFYLYCIAASKLGGIRGDNCVRALTSWW